MIQNYMKILLQLSIIKTLRFNIHYLGFASFVKNGPYVIVARNVKIKTLKGKVIIQDPVKRGILLGFDHDVNIMDGRYDRFMWHNTGTIVFHKKANLLMGCRISNNGYLEFGEDFYCNAGSTFLCRKEIRIGNGCTISWRTLFMDSDLHSIRDFEGNLLNANQTIIIQDDVWVGCNVTILKGTEIGKSSVVAAGSTIANKKFKEENVIIGGNGVILKRNIMVDMNPPV